jgi:hypothetical protein
MEILIPGGNILSNRYFIPCFLSSPEVCPCGYAAPLLIQLQLTVR